MTEQKRKKYTWMEIRKQAMEELQDQGFMFSMDDFGKGESNFLRLLDYDFDVLKVDKEFVWSIEENSYPDLSNRRHVWHSSRSISIRIF